MAIVDPSESVCSEKSEEEYHPPHSKSSSPARNPVQPLAPAARTRTLGLFAHLGREAPRHDPRKPAEMQPQQDNVERGEGDNPQPCASEHTRVELKYGGHGQNGGNIREKEAAELGAPSAEV